MIIIRAPYPLFFSYARQFRHVPVRKYPEIPRTECSVPLVFCSENIRNFVLPYSYAEAWMAAPQSQLHLSMEMCVLLTDHSKHCPIID